MQYRYRVLGKIEHSFILRGAYFEVGSTIDFYITDSEIDFVKERCNLETIKDLQETKFENSISKVVKPKISNSEKAVKNEQSNRKAKVKNKG